MDFSKLAGAQERSVAAARQMFEQLAPFTASGHLGVRLVDVDDDHAVLEMEITNKARQPYGMLHGGISLLLAETVASFHSTWITNPAERLPVGIEVSGSHLRSAREGTIRITGTIVRRSRTLVVHDVRVTHVDTDRELSIVRVTNLYRDTAKIFGGG